VRFLGSTLLAVGYQEPGLIDLFNTADPVSGRTGKRTRIHHGHAIGELLSDHCRAESPSLLVVDGAYAVTQYDAVWPCAAPRHQPFCGVNAHFAENCVYTSGDPATRERVNMYDLRTDCAAPSQSFVLPAGQSAAVAGVSPRRIVGDTARYGFGAVVFDRVAGRAVTRLLGGPTEAHLRADDDRIVTRQGSVVRVHAGGSFDERALLCEWRAEDALHAVLPADDVLFVAGRGARRRALVFG
jgi:hypothetical protein